MSKSKSERIRTHVKSHPGCTVTDIASAAKLPVAFVRTIVGQRAKAGEFHVDGVGCFTWNDGYVPGEGGGKRVQGNRATLRAQRRAGRHRKGGGKSPAADLGEFARRHLAAAQPAAGNQAVRELADVPPAQPTSPRLLAHARSTARAFASAIDTTAFGPLPAAAWKVHLEALELMDGQPAV